MKTMRIFAVCGLFACGAVAGPAAERPGRDAELGWLRKAEAAARGIEVTKQHPFRPNPREAALMSVAVRYAEAGHFDHARRVAAELPASEQVLATRFIAVSLAYAGRFDEAVREVKALANPGALNHVAKAVAQTDLARSMEIARDLPKSWRSSFYKDVVTRVAQTDLARCTEIARDLPKPWRAPFYENVVIRQVLAGDLDAAKATAARITGNRGNLRTARRYLTAGALVAAEGDIATVAARRGVKIRKVGFALLAIGKHHAEAGRLDEAARIFKALVTPLHRSSAAMALAECHLKANRTGQAKKLIAQALKDTAAIDDEATNAMDRASRYLRIARLQIRAGDLDAGARTARLAEASVKAASDHGIAAGLFKALGGKLAIIGLLIEAGHLDEARRMATRADGTLLPAAVATLASGFAAAGRMDDAEAVLGPGPKKEALYRIYLAAAKSVRKGPEAATRPAPAR